MRFAALQRKKKTILCLLLLLFLVFLYFWTKPTFSQTGTIKILDRNNTLLYESAGSLGKKIPVTYGKLPLYVINAAIASEDESFWTNHGIDLKAIIRSILSNSKEGRIVSGASTITQQLARAAIISPNQVSKRSFTRKIREILIALRLTRQYSKQDILTNYFNYMYFGNLAYGIQAASLTYFTKDVSQLSLAESALLVGLLSSPDRRNPFTNLPEAKVKQTQVLDRMVSKGFITPEDAREAKAERLSFTKPHTINKAPHFVQYILQELDTLGISQTHGITVTTTLDYPTFTLSEDVASLWVGRLANEHDLSNASLVLLNNQTGEILDMLGGIDYYDATHAGQVNMTTALRQPGSALKPVTYATAFLQGYTPATLMYDVKKVYKTKKGEGFSPNNYDGRYHGLVLAREALASSLNIPAVEMLSRVGIPNFLRVARDLGISTFTQEDRYDLSLTLGGGEVTLLDLSNVFASFARGGAYKQPYAIEKIVSDTGRVVYQHKDQASKEVFGNKSKQIAYLLSDILSDPKARIPGFSEKNPLVLSRPAAVKTGTTTDWHDNWTVGYTPRYTVGVWVGNTDNHAMREITGVVGAAPIWHQFLEEFLKGKPKETFVRPDGIVQKEICLASGKLPDQLCPEKATELFISGTQPTQVTHPYKKVPIDQRNGLLANATCPPAVVQEKTLLDYPPEVYTWAVEDGQEVIPHQFSPLCSATATQNGTAYLEISYPREKTVFESAPELVSNQAAVFEVSVSPDISSVIWSVDGGVIAQTSVFPFHASWRPVVGKHIITAFGLTSTGQKVNSNPVHITVVEYQANP